MMMDLTLLLAMVDDCIVNDDDYSGGNDYNDDDYDDVNDYNNDDGDIYIMMKCVSVCNEK